MAADRATERRARLAAALKQNLRRRKTGSGEASAVAAGFDPAGIAETAPHGGPKRQTKSPKSASKRN